MKLILLSGSHKEISIPYEIINYIKENITNIKISFIASEFDNFKNNDKFVTKLVNAFKSNKLVISDYNIIDNRLDNDNMINYIRNSNLVFLLGGDTLKQIKSINDYKLKTVINRVAKKEIIMGISAGAINMAKKVILAKDINDNIPELSVYKGLGLTTINIEPHCDFNDNEHWEELKKASFKGPLIIMHDNAFVIIDNNKINFYGDYGVLYDGIFYQKQDKKKFIESIGA